MKKILSLIKVSLSYDMNIFKINTKKKSKTSKVLVPIILAFYLMFMVFVYSNMLFDELTKVHLEFIVLTIFSLVVTILTFMEGIYKSGNLLFNCKDDNLVLSLPIKKSTILFIRMLKFYVFELLYNSLFIVPAMAVYAIRMHPSITYYLSSFVALILLPIVPIVLSCVIGVIITSLSSRFKSKNIVQTVFTTLFLLVFLYLSFNMNNLIKDIASSATSINDFVVKLYYPVGTYISLVNDFNIKTLLIYVLVHVVISFILIFIMSKVYFKINSNSKKVISHKSSERYTIRYRSKLGAFIYKELNKFVSTPVYITNAGFGLVLFIIGCVIIAIKFDDIAVLLAKGDNGVSIDGIIKNIPVYVMMLVAFGSFMTSITCSMISLEGKSFSILKSLPIKPINIILYKVITSLVIIIPFILIGDLILFIRFKIDLLSIILIILLSILFPLVTELFGILINLKYPKVDATNDTEVVKQSMSSFVSTTAGIGVVGFVIISAFKLISMELNNYLIMLIYLLIFGIICFVIYSILNKNCDKYFNDIKM